MEYCNEHQGVGIVCILVVGWGPTFPTCIYFCHPCVYMGLISLSSSKGDCHAAASFSSFSFHMKLILLSFSVRSCRGSEGCLAVPRGSIAVFAPISQLVFRAFVVVSLQSDIAVPFSTLEFVKLISWQQPNDSLS